MKTKYSSPALEVVSFSVLDSPRIGMQWWWHNDNGMGWEPAPAGYTLTPHPDNKGPIPVHFDACVGELLPEGDYTYWICFVQNLPGSCGQDSLNSGGQVMDDGKSC